MEKTEPHAFFTYLLRCMWTLLLLWMFSCFTFFNSVLLIVSFFFSKECMRLFIAKAFSLMMRQRYARGALWMNKCTGFFWFDLFFLKLLLHFKMLIFKKLKIVLIEKICKNNISLAIWVYKKEGRTNIFLMEPVMHKNWKWSYEYIKINYQNILQNLLHSLKIK